MEARDLQDGKYFRRRPDSFVIELSGVLRAEPGCPDECLTAAEELVDGQIEGVWDEYADGKGRPTTRVHAIQMVIGFTCNGNGQGVACEPKLCRRELRPIQPSQITIL